MSAQEYCSVCKAKALFNDKRCKEPYCSQKCQIIDWPKHKLSCLEMSELVPMNPTTPNTDVDLMAPLPSTSNLTPHRRLLKSLKDCHLDGNDHGDCSDNKLVSLNASPKTVVASLNASPKTVVVSDKSSSPTSTIIAQKQIEPEPRVKSAWQISFPPPKNDSFEVIVQYIDDRQKDGESLAWVTEFRYINSLQKMIDDINSTIDVRQATPGANEHVCIGALVAALTSNVLQRAKVMRVSKARQLAAVRFIDIGMEQHLSFSQIFKPIPSMFSVNAYAFCVSVKDAATRAIKEGESVKIRVLDLKSVEPIEIYAAEIEQKAVTCNDAGTTVDAEKAIKEYNFEDVLRMDITTGDNVELLILDASTIDKGYITAADLTSKEFLIQQCDVYFPKLEMYCKNATKPVGYEPSYNKLCVAIYPADGEWYRAVRIKDEGNDETITVKFIDYGNTSPVLKKSVLPIMPDLMFPTNANACYFKNALTKEQIVVLKTKQTLQCKVTERGQNEYIIWL